MLRVASDRRNPIRGYTLWDVSPSVGGGAFFTQLWPRPQLQTRLAADNTATGYRVWVVA